MLLTAILLGLVGCVLIFVGVVVIFSWAAQSGASCNRILTGAVC